MGVCKNFKLIISLITGASCGDGEADLFFDPHASGVSFHATNVLAGAIYASIGWWALPKGICSCEIGTIPRQEEKFEILILFESFIYSKGIGISAEEYLIAISRTEIVAASCQ